MTERVRIIRSFIRVNHRIRVPQVRCVDKDGEMLGVLPTQQAKLLAKEAGLDLVEISPQAEPPVCKIMDFGKFRYDEKRKERDARKKSHSLALKEIKFHVNVEEHDYQTKLGKVLKFLDKGHKVKLTLFFRGRENAHRELGFEVIKRAIVDCGDHASVDMAPKLVGRGVFSVVSPKKVIGGGKQSKDKK